MRAKQRAIKRPYFLILIIDCKKWFLMPLYLCVKQTSAGVHSDNYFVKWFRRFAYVMHPQKEHATRYRALRIVRETEGTRRSGK